VSFRKIKTMRDLRSAILSASEHSDEKSEAVWNHKVSRYLAFCVNGGFLSSRFDIKTMLSLMDCDQPSTSQSDLFTEIAYMLHLHTDDKSFTD